MKYWTSFIISCVLVASGCSGIKPEDKPVVNAIYQFAVLKLVKAHPDLKPKISQIVTDAQSALDGHNYITKAAAVQWISEEVNKQIGNDPDAQLLLQVIISQYMPAWDSTTLNILSDVQKKDLQDAINLTVLTLAMIPS